jgi:polyhydroxyalkanoate synthesis regulator phasin
MTENDGLRRYVEAATALTQITRSRAEELVRELIKAGELERHRAQDWVEDLVKTSRDRSEALVGTVRGEVRQQLKDLGFTNMDDLAKKVAAILAKSSAAGRQATHRPAAKVKKTSPKKGAPGKGGPGKSGAAKSTTRKATGTKKAAAKKAGA